MTLWEIVAVGDLGDGAVFMQPWLFGAWESKRAHRLLTGAQSHYANLLAEGVVGADVRFELRRAVLEPSWEFEALGDLQA